MSPPVDYQYNQGADEPTCSNPIRGPMSPPVATALPDRRPTVLEESICGFYNNNNNNNNNMVLSLQACAQR
eukprot:NODE_7601_length_558_cov_5.958743_g4460_i1.p2 GENE.NODE_7601_length_558_cov_5.958743_g4460_i1~~NODE_7601_length_558_cov_5.958743_g4460_i1.p2  ORF type:complete len:71 (+),score=6.77 NODE_7601_length_558_cov_5.958743_g4460_i1:202-414(+)